MKLGLGGQTRPLVVLPFCDALASMVSGQGRKLGAYGK